MGKLLIHAVLIIFSLYIATQIHVNHAMQAAAAAAAAADDQFELDTICLATEKLTNIHFYAQDIIGGPNATLYVVTRSNVSGDSPTSFGLILVADSPLTAEPSSSSEELGRAQGTLTSADENAIALAMNTNIVFTSGEYNGSTLSVAGRNPAAPQQRRLAIVGGTGVFRFARGYAVVAIYSTRVGDDSGVYNVLEYNIYTTFCPENVSDFEVVKESSKIDCGQGRR